MLIRQHWRRYSGRPTSAQRPGPWRVKPPFVATQMPPERMQGLVDQVLGVLRPVRVGGVDQIDAELGQPPEDGDRRVVVFGRSPYALAGDAHGAVAQTRYLEVAADLEGAGGSCSRAHRIVPFSWMVDIGRLWRSQTLCATERRRVPERSKRRPLHCAAPWP